MQVVLTPKDMAPRGIECDECGLKAKPGQWVFMHVVPNVIMIVIHRDCMKKCLDEIPEDLDTSIEVEYDRIREQYINDEVFECLI